MSAVQLIQDLTEAGVTVAVRGDKLRCTPRERMTPQLIHRVREHKPELLARLEYASDTLTADALWHQALDQLEGDPLFPPKVMEMLRAGKAAWGECRDS
mgnify:FL=1|jgi:hypothetical protein